MKKISVFVITTTFLWILMPGTKVFLQTENHLNPEMVTQQQEICYDQPVPYNWVIVNSYAANNRCGFVVNTNNYPNVDIIEYVGNYYVNTTLSICNYGPVPSDWSIISYQSVMNRCGETVNPNNVLNVRTIKRITGPTPTPTPPITRSPIGYLDGIDQGTRSAKGWSLDPDNPNASNQVHLYIDGPAGSGVPAWVIVASEPRPDVNQITGYPGNHGFTFQIPSQYFDNNNHTIYAYGIDTGSNPPTLLTNSPRTFNFGPLPQRTAYDYNSDGRADQAVFRDGYWYANLSPNNTFQATQFGQSQDVPVPSDYDGDGKTDFAVFRPDGSNRYWYILQSSNNQLRGLLFGVAVDKPVPADYDGDTKADIAVFRADSGNGYWHILNSSTTQTTSAQFGVATDKPVPADYDGDGKTDIAVYRPSNGIWYLQRSSQGSTSVQFGEANDKLVPADYDGDRKADVGVFRDGIWYLQRSRDGFTGISFGQPGDIPVQADYDGDGKADVAVYRIENGNAYWHVLQSSNGQVFSVQFGAANDIPAVGIMPQ